MNTLKSVALLILLVSFFPSCTHKQADDEPGTEGAASAVVQVKILPLRQGDLETSVSATGKTDVIRRQKALAPIGGTVVSLNALEGTTVKQGDILATIRPKETQAAIAGAEALLRGARNEAERREGERALQLAHSTQNAVSIRAAFDGVIATRSVTGGDIVNESSEILTLVDLSTMIFVADVPLRDARAVHPGQRAVVQFQVVSDVQYPAVVEAAYPVSDLQSQTQRVRLKMIDAGGLRTVRKTDMMGVCRIITGVHRNVLIIPKAALLRNDETDTYSVVVVQPDSVARIVPVTLGVLADSLVEVSGSALTPGMPVVVEGNYALPDSTRVRW
jgi:multidrug efflux pump subunit AcrA (membrane-fusion protein)